MCIYVDCVCACWKWTGRTVFTGDSEQLLTDNLSTEPAQLHLVRPAIANIVLIAPERLFHISSVHDI